MCATAAADDIIERDWARHLLWWVRSHPREYFNFDTLSQYPHFWMELIKENLDLPWNFYLMSGADFVTYRDIEENPTLFVEYVPMIFQNKNISIQFLRETPRLYKILQETKQSDWSHIHFSMNPTVTMETVKQNPKFPWNPVGLSLNENITFRDVLENPSDKWCLEYFIEPAKFSTHVTLDEIAAHRDMEWDWELLTYRVTYEEYKRYPDLPWDKEH